MLDPIADKLLVATTLLLLASDNTVGEWSPIAAIIILVREVAVWASANSSQVSASVSRSRASPNGRPRCRWSRSVSWIAGPAGDKVFSGVTITDGIGVISYIGLLLPWISAPVTLYTGYDYFRAGIRHIISEEM